VPRLVSAVVVAAALALAAGAAWGKSDSLEIHGRSAAFWPAARSGAWRLWSITVVNTTDSERKAKVALVTERKGRGEGVFSRTVTVPAMAARRADLLALTGLLDETPKASAAGPLGQTFFTLWDEPTGRMLARVYHPVTVFGPEVTVVASVGIADEDHDNSAYLERLGGNELGQVKLATATKPPARWGGYDIAQIVLVNEGRIASLGPSQLEAMLDWVRRGGVIVLAGGHRSVELLDGRLGRAAGVAAVGVHRVGRLALADPNGGEQFPPVVLDWPLPMVELCVESAEVVYEANGLPLLTRKALGSGWVFALSMPVGALQDTALHRVWWQVNRAHRARGPVDDARFPSAGRQTIQKIAGRRGPTRNVVVLLLLIPVVVSGAGGMLLLRRRRSELLWWALIPLAVLASAGMYLYGTLSRQDERLSYIGLVSGSPDGSARVQQFFAYYSGPEARTATFSAGGPRGLIRDAALAGTGLQQGEVTTDTQVAMHDQAIEVNNTRAFYVDTMVPTRGVTADLTFDSGGVAGKVINHLGHDVTDSVIYVNRRTYRLRTPGREGGTIASGAETKVTVADADLLGRVRFHQGPPRPGAAPRRYAKGEFTSALQKTTTDRLRNKLLGEIVGTPGILGGVGRQPVLIGYTAGSLLDPVGKAGLAGHGWCVAVFPVTFSPPAPGAVLVPSGFVDVRYSGTGAPVWDPMNERFNRTFRPTELIVRAAPPTAVGPLDEAELILRVAMDATGYRLVVSGVGPGGGQGPANTPLGSFDNPRRIDLAVPRAGRFRTAGGTYVLSLRVERIDPGPTAQAGDTDNMMDWAFESVDVSVKGIRR